MSKIVIAAVAAITFFIVFLDAAVNGVASAVFGGGTSQPSQTAVQDIPTDYLVLYQQAATVCPGLDWNVLAAIGKIETNHGRSTLPGVHDSANAAGAEGVMQFLPSTFHAVVSRHPIPPGGSSPPSPYNPHDAIYAAAWNLCDNGAGRGDLQAAIYSYNHAQWYVNEVLAQAAHYAASGQCDAVATSVTAHTAVTFACGQHGQPYVWGGNGPRDGGFDCSGLTRAAYLAAGIDLPRTAQEQYNRGPLLPAGTPLEPGDLIFYGTPGNIHHVALYIGHNRIVHAPDAGQRVQISSMTSIPDLAGASRP